MGRERLEEKLRNHLQTEVREAEPPPEWWNNAISHASDQVPTLSLTANMWRWFNKPVSRAATAVALVIILAISILWGTGMIPGFGSKEAPTSTISSRPPQRVGSGQTSWAIGFDNLDDLVAYSDAIVVGVIDKALDVGDSSPRWSLRVEKVLKGKDTSDLIVRQDDPPFLPGERYLLFLREGNSGTYFIFAHGSRYSIWDNKVYSMNYILPPGVEYAPPGLDYDGINLDIITGNIVGLVDSVRLTFTQGTPRLPADVLRYRPGVTLNIDVTVSTGKFGPGKVTLTVNRTTFPEGLEANIDPIDFTVSSRSEYKSNLTITTSQNLQPGTYRISVEYDFNGIRSGERTITLYVDPR